MPEDLVALALWMAAEYCSTPARALSLVLPPRGRERTALWAERAGDLDGQRLTDRQRELLARLPAPAGGDLPALRRLEARGLVTIAPRAQRRSPAHEPGRRPGRWRSRPSRPRRWTAFRAGGSHLLHGVTGSGKTEVYLRAFAEALEGGKGAIVLVPEIALTPQTVAPLHGALRARRGGAALGAGGGGARRRLAANAPRGGCGSRSARARRCSRRCRDLGLIIVDEEHDASFKQEEDLRYDARHVAAERARRAGATLLAGSATPRPEPRRAAAGEAVEPGRRAGAAAGAGPRHARGARPAAPDTRRALAAAGKSIVLLNRRGWSNFLTCRGVREGLDVPELRRRARAASRRGALAPATTAGIARGCPSAATPAGRSRGPLRGGHRAARVRARRDPRGARVPARRGRRAAKDAVPDLLARVPRRAAGGSCRHADGGEGPRLPRCHARRRPRRRRTLRFPDFRAEERTFALVAQLAGRAGRGEKGGRVLVQTMAPDAPAIAAASRHDAEGFLPGELERRRALRYPPFSALIRVVAGRRREPVGEARAVAEPIASATDAAPEILGPAPLFACAGGSAPGRGPAPRARGRDRPAGPRWRPRPRRPSAPPRSGSTSTPNDWADAAPCDLGSEREAL